MYACKMKMKKKKKRRRKKKQLLLHNRLPTVGVTNGSYMTYGGRLVRYLVAKRHPL